MQFGVYQDLLPLSVLVQGYPSKDDLIICLDNFGKFGFSLNGVLTKLPGPGVVQPILDNFDDDSNANEQSAELDPRVAEALKRNAKSIPYQCAPIL